MARFHVVYDFSNGVDSQPAQVPYTPAEEAQADAAATAALAAQAIANAPGPAQLLSEIKDRLDKLAALGIAV